jgi:hypothetical protein
MPAMLDRQFHFPRLGDGATRVWRLGLCALGIGTAVAVILALLFRQHFGITLVYSLCISMGCTFAIDLSRRAASAWVHRHAAPDDPAALNHWPGWGWMWLCLVLGTVAGFFAGAELGNWLTGTRTKGLHSGSRNVSGALLLMSLVPGVAATFYFHAKARLQAAQAQRDAAERLAAETRLKLLESQLEPHMLFNTLANLRALIAVDPERAQQMLDRLIDFLRATLGGSRAPLHPLSAEFSRLADYLALMQVRMGDRLKVELDLPPGLAGVSVPPLLLQPLVENAIKHGLEPRRAGGTIQVSARREGAELVLRVADSGAGLEASRHDPASPGIGFGVAQVRERLATQFGAASSLTLEPGPPETGGTLATLRWPQPEIHP